MKGLPTLLERINFLDSNTILIEFEQPMEVVSTLPVITPNGCVKGAVKAVVLKRVDNSELDNPIEYYKRIVKELNLDKALIVTTSAPLDQKFKYLSVREVSTNLYMTISLKPPTCLESNTYPPVLIGTINIIAITYLPLSYNALVDLLKTITEAKTLASADSLLYCRSRSPGTVSDSVSVLRPLNVREEILFTGMSTNIGNVLARTIYNEILREALNKDVNELLKDMTGIDVDLLLRLLSEIYSQYPIQGLNASDALSYALVSLRKALKDPNVWSLIIAARELDIHGLAGTIPGVTKDEFVSDSKKIVADEVIGMSIATYLAGTNGLFTMYWIERLKEVGVLKHGGFGVFLDDVVSALLAYMVVDLIRRVNNDEG